MKKNVTRVVSILLLALVAIHVTASAGFSEFLDPNSDIASQCVYPGDKQLYRSHWLACSGTLYFEHSRRAFAESKLWEEKCSIQKDFSDDGSLWKPISENSGRPVVLLPASYWDNAATLELYAPYGIRLEQLRPRSCCPNGNRAHYDVTIRTASQLPYETRLFITFKDGSTECRNIFNPIERQE